MNFNDDNEIINNIGSINNNDKFMLDNNNRYVFDSNTNKIYAIDDNNNTSNKEIKWKKNKKKFELLGINEDEYNILIKNTNKNVIFDTERNTQSGIPKQIYNNEVQQSNNEENVDSRGRARVKSPTKVRNGGNSNNNNKGKTKSPSRAKSPTKTLKKFVGSINNNKIKNQEEGYNSNPNTNSNTNSLTNSNNNINLNNLTNNNNNTNNNVVNPVVNISSSSFSSSSLGNQFEEKMKDIINEIENENHNKELNNINNNSKINNVNGKEEDNNNNGNNKVVNSGNNDYISDNVIEKYIITSDNVVINNSKSVPDLSKQDNSIPAMNNTMNNSCSSSSSSCSGGSSSSSNNSSSSSSTKPLTTNEIFKQNIKKKKKNDDDFLFNHHQIKTSITHNRDTFVQKKTNIVKLNVGGKRFITREATLTENGTKDNFFSALLSNKFPVDVDEKGYIFIDRNPKVFEVILDSLRTGKLYVPKNIKWSRVIEESAYYGVDLNGVDVEGILISDEQLCELVDTGGYVQHCDIIETIVTSIKDIFPQIAKAGKRHISILIGPHEQTCENRFKEAVQNKLSQHFSEQVNNEGARLLNAYQPPPCDLYDNSVYEGVCAIFEDIKLHLQSKYSLSVQLNFQYYDHTINRFRSSKPDYYNPFIIELYEITWVRPNYNNTTNGTSSYRQIGYPVNEALTFNV